MGFYGSFVLARSGTLLPDGPAVRSAFGSRCMAVHRYRGGWQLADLYPPMHHEWPAIHGGPARVAAATGGPVLAVEIKESYCLQYGAAIPSGPAWLAHFVDAAGLTVPATAPCAFDHHEECTVPLADGADVPADDQPGLAERLSGWAAAAGLSAPAGRILQAIGRHTDDEAVWGLIDALGLEPVETVEPLFAFDDGAWWDAWRIGDDAGLRVMRAWNAQRNGRGLPSYDLPRPGADEFVRFLDLVAAARFGGGLTQDELRDEAARLLEAYPEP